MIINESDFSEHEGESSTWIALADLMTGLMAIFLVISMVILTNQDRTRVLIIQSIQEQMKKEGIKVDIDPKTGDISIADNILFGFGSSELSYDGKVFLDKFIPSYSSVLFSKLTAEQLAQVSRIIVEGHGSRDNNNSSDYSKNMTLSLKRADAVAQYVNNMPDFAYKDKLLVKLTPVGRGNIDAKPFNDASDRKVLFKFQFSSDLFKQMTSDQLVKRIEHQ